MKACAQSTQAYHLPEHFEQPNLIFGPLWCQTFRVTLIFHDPNVCPSAENNQLSTVNGELISIKDKCLTGDQSDDFGSRGYFGVDVPMPPY